MITFLSIIGWMFLLALIGLAICALCVFVLAGWMASGEPDATDAAMRDAGFGPNEIEAASSHWDRGSRETETRPNLPYARRLNRERLRGVSGV